jgi:hypothetical protein
MIATAPALIRRATTDRIGNILRRNDVAVPDAGLFGGPANLPSGAGPIDPPILTGGYPGNTPVPTPTPGPLTTRMDPNMGYISPSIQISGGGPNSSNPTFGGISFGPGGQLQGGVNGPQGTVYGIDPNTGQSIFNVTGSPRPGFFDSPAGKVVETAGATGLNVLAPGLGSVSRWILDAIRNRNTAAHTGTDLSGQGGTHPATTPQAPSGPAWYQPGYQPSPGIQDAIARGDYQRAYGPSATSITDLNEMAAQAYGGAPNMPQPDDFGEFGPGRQMGFSRTRGAPPINTNAASVAAFNNWLAAHKGGG